MAERNAGKLCTSESIVCSILMGCVHKRSITASRFMNSKQGRRSSKNIKMRPGDAVERRDREIIKSLPESFADLSGRSGRRIVGLFTKDPSTLLQSEPEVLGEVRFINSYPEYWRGKRPHRTSDHGTWHLRETAEIYNEHGNQIGFMCKYDYRPRRNGGREQGPKLGLREYAYYPVGCNEHSLCIIYEKRPKKESRRNGEGSSVEQQPNLQIAPPLPLMTAAPNSNYAVAGPIAAAAAAAEGWDFADDFSKYGWFGFGEMPQ